MFSWVDVDFLRVGALMFASAWIFVAHLTVKGVHLLNSIFSHCALIFIVKSFAIQSILKIQSLFTLAEQLFAFCSTLLKTGKNRIH